MSPVEWFYAQQNKRFGPVSAAELKALADSGKLRPDDLVWREGMDGWVPARRVKGLFEADSQLASAPTALAEVSGSGGPDSSGDASAMEAPGALYTPPPVSIGAERAVAGFEGSVVAFHRAREGTSIHLFDLLLDLFRHSFPAGLVEATSQAFSLLGYYTLYGAILLWVILMVLAGVEARQISSLGWAIAGAVGLLVLQYTVGRFLPALERLNKSSPARLCSTAFLDCLALFLLALGVAAVLAMVVYAVQENEYLLLLLAVELFIVVELAALVAVAPETLQISVSEETRAGEEALGIWTFLLKLLVKLTPVLFGLGVLHGTIELLYILVLLVLQKPTPPLTPWTPFVHIAAAAALPLLGYLGFLSSYLAIDLCRAVLQLPRLLTKPSERPEQEPTED